MSFLETMARNSKCNMQELLLIHYQRPEARDCKSYQEWIQSGRQVKRGAIGITVRDKENPEKVRYLFEVADTVGLSMPSAVLLMTTGMHMKKLFLLESWNATKDGTNMPPRCNS